jgi:hypothetical protein
VYINGLETASRTGLPALAYDAAAIPVTIGSDLAANVSSSRFYGRIDDIALCNRALTRNEIFDIYNADIAGRHVSRPYFTTPPACLQRQWD